jgi:hypothetical protein
VHSTLEVERVRLASCANQGAHGNVVRLAVGVDDLEVEHLDVIAARSQLDGLEAALASADLDRVAILADERNLLAAEFYPFAVAPLSKRVTGRQARQCQCADQNREFLELHHGCPVVLA